MLSYELDPIRRLVAVTVGGTVSPVDVGVLGASLRADPAFQAETCDVIVHCRGPVTNRRVIRSKDPMAWQLSRLAWVVGQCRIAFVVCDRAGMWNGLTTWLTRWTGLEARLFSSTEAAHAWIEERRRPPGDRAVEATQAGRGGPSARTAPAAIG